PSQLLSFGQKTGIQAHATARHTCGHTGRQSVAIRDDPASSQCRWSAPVRATCAADWGKCAAGRLYCRTPTGAACIASRTGR
ncbi:MAG TPA: hypothetical protein PLM32_01475, partial [Candidatus Competibacter sp.]|nr:hypothetical protein [Candidatus Competibacter sp.]